MTVWQKSLVWIIGVVATIFVASQAFLYFAFSDICGNEIWAEYNSADGELRAVIFERNCGGTTGFSTQVSILEVDNALPNEGGNIYVVDGRPDAVAPTISWLNDDVLRVTRSAHPPEYLAADTWESSSFFSSRSVEVRYDP